jgi:hypothetical protein
MTSSLVTASQAALGDRRSDEVAVGSSGRRVCGTCPQTGGGENGTDSPYVDVPYGGNL